MNNYRRILLVVDLGEQSERVGARARDLAALCGAELSMLHVVEYVPVEPMGETLLPAVQIEEELVQRAAPPQKPGEEVKLLYASQIGTAPPAFAIVSNRPDEVAESYQRYLVHGFRDAWSFTGSPVRLKFTSRGARRR